ncbi:hypothetical protein AS038_08590 [Arthrobacter sp. NIO-1057]|nr:hypothetical protein AS038_08590 [Arthrobacter sp. NIO-1057]
MAGTDAPKKRIAAPHRGPEQWRSEILGKVQTSFLLVQLRDLRMIILSAVRILVSQLLNAEHFYQIVTFDDFWFGMKLP